jgi:hypothetical protein
MIFVKDSQRKAIHANKDKISVNLNNLAKIPYSTLEKLEFDDSKGYTKFDKRKLRMAMNLRTMRGMSNNPNGMFGMRNNYD